MSLQRKCKRQCDTSLAWIFSFCPLSLSLTHSLSSLLRALPAAQCLEIFDCFIKKFKEMHLPLIEQLIISRSAKKMRREQESGTILIPIDSRHGYSTISGLLLYVDILSFFISNLSLELFIKGREQEEMKERIKDVTNNIYSSLLQAAIEKVN